MSHLAQYVIEDAFDWLARPWLLAHLEMVKIESRKQGIVIEHLLEVRYEPARVGRVAMKTTAKLIVHASIGHLPARVAAHLERVAIAGASVCAQQKLERHRGWKLRRAAKTAVNRIVISDHAGVSGIEQLRLDRMI